MRKLHILLLLIVGGILMPAPAYAIGFTAAAALGLTAATAAGGVGLTGVGLAVGAGITAAAVGGGIWAVSKMTAQPKGQGFTGPTIQAPDESKAKAAAAKSIEDKRRGMARNVTQYTGPLGLTDIEKSNLATKTLLGA